MPKGNISKTDEVAVLYRCLPGRAVHYTSVGTSFVCLKDRLTVVLAVYADGKKAPLTVIEKAKNPVAFLGTLAVHMILDNTGSTKNTFAKRKISGHLLLDASTQPLINRKRPVNNLSTTVRLTQ